MTPFQLALWALLMSLPRHTHDAAETYAERAGRMAVTAVAIADAADGDRWRAARLLALGRAESRFAEYVGEGRCLDGPRDARCDQDSHGVPQSLGYWQPRRCACPEAWAQPPGSVEGLRAAARCADRLLRAGYRRCSTRIEGPDKERGAFAGYAGADCDWSGGVLRAQMVGSYHQKLRRLLGVR